MDYKERIIQAFEGDELADNEKETLKRIFPELCLSEDEKTRNELLQHLFDCSIGVTKVVNTTDFGRWFDWLEKQKPMKVLPIFRVGDELSKKGFPFFVERIEDGYYCCDSHGMTLPFEEQSEWELVDVNKPKWNEEDERMVLLLNNVLGHDEDLSFETKVGINNWLNSIKERL